MAGRICGAVVASSKLRRMARYAIVLMIAVVYLAAMFFLGKGIFCWHPESMSGWADAKAALGIGYVLAPLFLAGLLYGKSKWGAGFVVLGWLVVFVAVVQLYAPVR